MDSRRKEGHWMTEFKRRPQLDRMQEEVRLWGNVYSRVCLSREAGHQLSPVVGGRKDCQYIKTKILYDGLNLTTVYVTTSLRR
jgi:hypothetical protein